MKPALVSVIVPAYNAAATLGDALLSIQRSDGPLEIIVVDDGSQDSTADVARAFSDVQLIRTANRGAAHARNVGIEACQGEYITFLDSDDRWLEGRIEGSLYPFTAYNDVELICCDFIKTYNGQPMVRGFEQHHTAMTTARHEQGNIMIWDHAFEAMCQSLFVTTSAAIVRATTVRRLGGFDESFPIAEDMDLWLAMARKGRVVALNRVLIEKRDTTGSLGSDQDRVLACTDAMLATFLQRRGSLTHSQRSAVRRKRSELNRARGYCARCRGDRIMACRSYLSSLALAPTRQAMRGLAASIIAPAPGGWT